MIIRLEQPKDYREVENLTREAFWNVYRPGCTEHCAQFVDEVNKNMPKPMTKDEYKQMMRGFFPMLKRWRK